MCGWCCPICQVADSAQKLGESYLLYFVLGCFVPCVPVFLVRDKAREKYGLEGSTGKNHNFSYFFVLFCTLYTTVISKFHESQQQQRTVYKLRHLYVSSFLTGGDALAACCCGCCVSVQVANELDERGA